MRRSRFIALSVLLDGALVNLGIVGSFFLRFGGELPDFNFAPFVTLAPFITLVYLATGYVYGLYEPERIENPWAVVRAVVSAVSLGTALTTALLFFAGPDFLSFSRLVIVLSWVVLGALLAGWRLLFMRFSEITWPEQRIVIVGTDPVAFELAEELRRCSHRGYRVVGHVASGAGTVSGAGAAADAPPVLGDLSDLVRIVAENGVQRVIVVSPVAVRELIEGLVLANELDVRVDVVPELYEIFIGTVDGMVADIPLMEITRPAAPPWFASAKRVMDIVGSLLLLMALSPLIVLGALAVLVTMGRPVFYVQERVGEEMRTFRLYKLRTMVREAEAETGPVLARPDDRRVTRVGRFLRTYRIDEFPQLANILKGEMSFVGPRPERPHFVERHMSEIPAYRERFAVKPGATGLAQVSGGYATTPERKLKYDLIYMYHQNLPMDLQIVIETIRTVLTGRGAR